MITDLRYALRLLTKSPWFTALTVLVLAGGLGISLYTYAALNMMIYRDLPLPDGGSIVRIGYGEWPNVRAARHVRAGRLCERKHRASTSSASTASRARSSAIPARAAASWSVESDWRIFEFTRVPPLLGRGFVGDDGSAGAEPVAVLGYRPGSPRLRATRTSSARSRGSTGSPRASSASCRKAMRSR